MAERLRVRRPFALVTGVALLAVGGGAAVDQLTSAPFAAGAAIILLVGGVAASALLIAGWTATRDDSAG